LIGSGPLVERLWTRPALSVLGIDAPRTGEAPNALVPSARAKLSLRIAPGEDPKSAYQAVEAHLRAHAPWGAAVEVIPDGLGSPCEIPVGGPAYQVARAAFRTAWDGVEPADIGVGGSIPFIATFQEMFPGSEILVTGVGDPYSKSHGPNESLHLAEFVRTCLAEALLLNSLPAAA
jgi:acetylornithine deacetylase/succinyl-diaminopimelate desuccinylase-like protein